MWKMIEGIYTPRDQAESLVSMCRGAGYDETLVGSSGESGWDGLYFLVHPPCGARGELGRGGAWSLTIQLLRNLCLQRAFQLVPGIGKFGKHGFRLMGNCRQFLRAKGLSCSTGTPRKHWACAPLGCRFCRRCCGSAEPWVS